MKTLNSSIAQTRKRNVAAFDVMKIILAFVIVSLHSGVGTYLLNPYSTYIRNLQNLAVPCFFLISSILFFSKVFEESDEVSQSKLLWKYEKRLIILYGLWQIILCPVTIVTHEYFNQGTWGILLYLKDMFFSYTFPASWFFGALILAMPIVYVFKNVNFLLVVLFVGIYLYFTFLKLFPDSWQIPFEWYRTNVGSPRFSFPEALIWLSLGCFIVKMNKQPMTQFVISKSIIWGGVISVVIAIFLKEFMFIGVLALMVLFISIKYPQSDSCFYVRLRKYSTILYCSHYTIIHLLWQFLPLNYTVLICLVAIFLCLIISELLFWLAKSRCFTFVKYMM